MGCRRLTYYQADQLPELKAIRPNKELTLKSSSEKVRRSYVYGFNGKERDQSFGNVHYDYGFRIYNPSIGRFLSVDPLTRSFPMLTPYQYASNTPIAAIDLDGLEGVIAPPAPPPVPVLVPLPPPASGTNSNTNSIQPKHVLDDEFWGMGEPFRMLIKAYTPDWTDQDDYENQELDFYEIRLRNGEPLSDWEEERYLDLLAKKRGIYLSKEDLRNPDLFKVGPEMPKMLGENGPIIQSKTIWREKGTRRTRIDIENPNPGQRPGQIHYQDENNQKYMYDPEQDRFFGKNKETGDYDVPAPAVDKRLNDQDFRKAIDKGKRMLDGG